MRSSLPKEAVMSELSEKQRDDLSKGEFAFPKKRKEPIEDTKEY